MKPNIEIPAAELEKIAALLNGLLADEYVIYTKTRNAHWNIQGQNFMELHKFFQSQYEQLFIIIDDVGERVRMLGHFAIGSLKDFLKFTHLPEQTNEFTDQRQVLKALIADHESIIRNIRMEIAPVSESSNDIGSTDFVTGIMEQHEKMAWMLRAYLG